MCSIGEDDFGDEGGLHAMPKDEEYPNVNDKFKTCAKCGTEGAVIKLKFREPECNECFLAYTRHKFRAALGSSKILPKEAEVLILFDGSAESLVLLDMMQYAKTQSTHKRLHVKAYILFIDETSINEDIELSKILDLLSNFDFESYIISMTNKHMFNIKEINSYLESKRDEFSKPFQEIRSLTSRQDFLKIWKNDVIQRGAAQLKCNYVFSPDINTSLATDLLTSIALGRGGSAALDVSLLDDRLPNLKLIRPLRNLTSDEVKFYLDVQKLKPAKQILFGNNLGSSYSIQNLTKRFVEDLQSNFSSTVSTVFRTGDKIAPITTETDSSNICHFCNSPMDFKTSKTLQAVELSRIASALSGFTDNRNETVTKKSVYPGNLCHACQNIQNDCENINLGTKEIKPK